MRRISLLTACFLSIFIFGCKNRDKKQSCSTSNLETLLTVNNKDGKIATDVISKGDTTIGNFHVTYSIADNEIIADTIIVSETENQLIGNHSVFLTIQYKGQPILDNYEIRSTTFDWINNPERFILSPMGSVEFEEINNVLVVKTGMFVMDTDWGYFVTIKISEKGEVSIFTDDADDFYETE